MNDGWIKLYRKIRDTKFWENKPFSKGQAWIDLLFDVNFKTTKIIHKKKYLQIRPGQLFISQRKYAKKWGWSKTKVRDYFQTLENLDQIQTIKKTTLGTLVMVVNWTLYQSGEILKNHPKDHKKTTKRPLKDHPTTSNIHQVNNSESDKNDKNLKNDKKSTITLSQINNLISSFPSNLKPLINEYIDIARLQNKTEKISLYRQKRLLDELLLLWNNYKGNDIDEADYRKALKITINNQAPNINYVRKVIQGMVNKRSMRMKRGTISS